MVIFGLPFFFSGTFFLNLNCLSNSTFYQKHTYLAIGLMHVSQNWQILGWSNFNAYLYHCKVELLHNSLIALFFFL